MANLTTRDAEVARTILEDIDNRNFKKALKDVEKKLKKTESEYFKALQTLIKAHIGQVSEKSVILLQLEELVIAKRMLTDLDTIQFYEEALGLILPKSGECWARIIGRLRWELVKASPKDVEASRACFRACVANEDYEHARHIANSLEKTFPGNHEYIFWNITTMFLFSQCSIYPEKDRNLYGALAQGLIRKLADATVKAANTTPLPVRCIRTPQELLLMDIILKSGGEEKMNLVRLNYLQNAFLSPESTIAKGEWQLWRLKLELLKNEPELLFKTTADLLQRARRKDDTGQITESRFSDWVVWKSYVDAASTNKSKYKDDVEAEIKAHLGPKSGVDKAWRRNASLALLRFAFTSTPFSESDMSGHYDVDLVVQYLRRYGDANIAYTDLRPFIPLLGFQELGRFLSSLIENEENPISESEAAKNSLAQRSLVPLNQQVDTASGITKLVNQYKLIYLITSSMPEHARRSSPEKNRTCLRCITSIDLYCDWCLTEIARGTMNSYGRAMDDGGRITKTLLPTDIHPADDLCILSVMCLAKLSMNGGKYSADDSLGNPTVYHLLQAAVLLEYAWKHSKANSQIVLLLTRLYSILGCGSLAMRAYQRLGVKQIQHTTLSHYMFDGISTFHPHPFTSDDSSQQRTIIDELRDQQKIYKTSPKHISNKRWSSFEHNNYNTIFELEEFKKALTYNVSAVMTIVESRKVSRLMQPNVSLATSFGGYDILPPDVEKLTTKFSDKNDYDAMPNFEIVGEESPFARLHQAGRAPFSDSRIHMDLFTEKVLTIIDSIADSDSTISARLWIDENINQISELLDRNEQICLDFRYASYYAISRIFQGVSAFEIDLCRLLKDRLSSLEKYRFAAPASEQVLYTLYVSYEIATSVLRLHRLLTRTGSGELHESLDLAGRLVNTVIEQSSAVKKSLDEGGWIDKVLKSVFQGDIDVEDTTSIPGTLKAVVDENFMEEWAGQVVDSWKDSVKGFVYFKAGR